MSLDATTVEAELGVRYLAGKDLPEEPPPWVGGVAWLSPHQIVVTEWRRRQVHIVDLSARCPAATLTLDSRPRGVHACGDGVAVVCEPDAGQLTLVTGGGRVIACAELPIAPWYAAPWRDGWLVTVAYRNAVFLVTGGRVTELRLPFAPQALRSAVPTSDETFLCCDQCIHMAAHVALDGRLLGSFGRHGWPAGSDDCLIGPEHAMPCGGDRILISDTRNNRVLLADRAGRAKVLAGGSGRIGSAPGHLWSPIAAAPATDGRMVIADAGNGRAVLLAPDGTSEEVWGEGVVERFELQYPRSQEPCSGGYLVADSYNNRIVRTDTAGRHVGEYAEACGSPFFWPRFATQAGREVFICDSRNRRIVVITPGQTARLLRARRHGREHEIADPHVIRPTAGGLLITDTKNDEVVLTSSTGEVRWTWGAGKDGRRVDAVVDVSDLHDAAVVGDSLWLVDTGHHRVLRVDDRGTILAEIHSLRSPTGDALQPLSYPRSVEFVGERLLVTDSGNHRVVLLTADGVVEHTFGGRARSHARGCLSDPRRATVHAGMVFVADYGNNRVVRTRLPGNEAMPVAGSARTV